MKITIGEVTRIGFAEALGELIKFCFPTKTTMELAESTTVIATKITEYAKIENAKIEIFGKKDSEGHVIKKELMNMPGRSIVEFESSEDERKYLEERENIKKEEFDIPLSEPIDILELEKKHKEINKPFNITPELIVNLGKLIKTLN